MHKIYNSNGIQEFQNVQYITTVISKDVKHYSLEKMELFFNYG